MWDFRAVTSREETTSKICENESYKTSLNLIIVQQDAIVFSLLYFCRQLYMFRVK